MGTIKCPDCGVNIKQYQARAERLAAQQTPPPVWHFAILLRRLRSSWHLVSLAILITVLVVLGTYGMYHSFTNVRDDIRYAPMRVEIIKMREILAHGRFSLVDFRRMSQRYISQVANLKSRMKTDKNQELLEILDISVNYLSTADDTWSHAINAGVHQVKSGRLKQIRTEALEQFLHTSALALKIMDKN
jgi:hypothetical protein